MHGKNVQNFEQSLNSYASCRVKGDVVFSSALYCKYLQVATSRKLVNIGNTIYRARRGGCNDFQDGYVKGVYDAFFALNRNWITVWSLDYWMVCMSRRRRSVEENQM